VGLGWIKYDFHSLLSIWKIWERLLRKPAREENAKWKINSSTKGHFHNEVSRLLAVDDLPSRSFRITSWFTGIFSEGIHHPTNEGAKAVQLSLTGVEFPINFRCS
jgi:hypothetical protein